MFIRKEKLKELMFNISKEIYKQYGRNLSIKDQLKINNAIDKEINKVKRK